LGPVAAVSADDEIPPDCRIARATDDWQRLLLNPMDDAASVTIGAWKMQGTYVKTAESVPPKVGWTALTLGAAEAELAEAKGDFRVRQDVQGQTPTMGMWVHLAKDSNVARVGVQVYEPNLNPSPTAAWGGWAAPMDTYYEMMRFGAEAVKRADPNAVVTSAGYAGMSVDVVDPLRTFEYSDGKHPLDFVDLINVHFYSGQEPPETCRTDGNASVTSSTTFPENLRELVAWRDLYAPGKPIWMTETGYDSAGPFGTTEAIQAARLPRVVMLCLAHGVDKVFVYRESGSTPSMHACSGVLRDDFSPKPSWYTLGTAVRQLHGVRGSARRMPHPDPDVWLLEWDAGGEPLLTAWTVEGTARLGIDLGGCRVTDAFGGVTSPDSTADLSITPFPQYIRDFVSSEPLARLHAEYQRHEAARTARLERIASLRKYLFDFGSTQFVGRSNIEGYRADYLPVLHTAVWDEQRGYGFDKAAFQDDDQPWMKGQNLERDGTRVRDHVFQFRVEPGQYDLQMSVVSFSERGQVIVSGIEGGPLTLDVRKKDPVKNVQIKVAGNEPVIGIQLQNDYGHFRWIRCVETLVP